MDDEVQALTRRINELEYELKQFKLAIDTDDERNGWMYDHLREAPQQIFAILVQYLDNNLSDFSAKNFEQEVSKIMLETYDKNAPNLVWNWEKDRTKEIMSEMLPGYDNDHQTPGGEPPSAKK